MQSNSLLTQLVLREYVEEGLRVYIYSIVTHRQGKVMIEGSGMIRIHFPATPMLSCFA